MFRTHGRCTKEFVVQRTLKCLIFVHYYAYENILTSKINEITVCANAVEGGMHIQTGLYVKVLAHTQCIHVGRVKAS